MNKKDYDRLIELETIAKQIFIDNSDWDAVINMLGIDEKSEYYKLKKKRMN